LGGEYGNDLPFFQSKVAAFPGSLYLVYRLAYNDDIVGPPARREEDAYLNRYVTDPAAAGQPPAHFQRNPLGRGRFRGDYG
jgi:hypothetical protein